MVINHEDADDKHFSLFSGLLFKNHFFYILKTQILGSTHWARGHRQKERPISQLALKVALRDSIPPFIIVASIFGREVLWEQKWIFQNPDILSVRDPCIYSFNICWWHINCKALGERKLLPLRMDCCCTQAWTHMCNHTHTHSHTKSPPTHIHHISICLIKIIITPIAHS